MSRARTSVSTGSIYVDTAELKALARDLARAHPVLSKELKLQVRAAGDLVKEEAKRRTGYSKRIPRSLRTSVTAFGTTEKVVAGGAKAADAAPIENRGKGFPRHPLFGTRTHWYTTNRPAFLAPALEDKAEEVAELIAQATDRAFDALGFS